MMFRSLFLLCILFSSILSAERSITPYLTSENDTLALVDGIVNAYNGKLVQINKDIEIQGSDPLELTRYYDGGHHFNSLYGYGVGFNLPVLLLFDPKEDTLLVEQRGGSFLLFKIEKKRDRLIGKIDPEIFRHGYTNCCEALLRGEADLSATSVNGTENAFVVDLGNGVKRHYEFYFKNKKKIRHYRLTREELPSGNIRNFSYECSILLNRVWTTNQDQSSTFNWMNFSYGSNSYSVTASNGQQVQYDLEIKKGKAGWSSIEGGIPINYEVKYKTGLLTKVTGQHILETHYDSLLRTFFAESIFSTKTIKRPDGRSLDVEYDDLERVKRLSLSGEPLYTFDYYPGCTIVTDALGNVKKYQFDKRRLKKLTEPHRTQQYSWNDRGQLLAHAIEDLNGTPVSKREYIPKQIQESVSAVVVSL